jgi:hypothetical protein
VGVESPWSIPHQFETGPCRFLLCFALLLFAFILFLTFFSFDFFCVKFGFSGFTTSSFFLFFRKFQIYSQIDGISRNCDVWFLKETQVETSEKSNFSIVCDLNSCPKEWKTHDLKEFEELWDHFIFISDNFYGNQIKVEKIYLKSIFGFKFHYNELWSSFYHQFNELNGKSEREL